MYDVGFLCFAFVFRTFIYGVMDVQCVSFSGCMNVLFQVI